ncbi:MAG: hypothetical protein HCTETUND1_053 [Candidatus Hodgkinia cicadicola]|nr:MAG: hypothetical protein HCTETUND1_053 [Candidatus Hodgkinia cicadicola]
MQQAIDYLVTSYLRLKRRKTTSAKSEKRVINAAENMAERKTLEAKNTKHKRARAKAKAVPQTAKTAIVNNESNS